MQVDMRKVNLDILRDWVVKKITSLVGFEDEVVIEYALGLLEDKSKPVSIFESMYYSVISLTLHVL